MMAKVHVRSSRPRVRDEATSNMPQESTVHAWENQLSSTTRSMVARCAVPRGGGVHNSLTGAGKSDKSLRSIIVCWPRTPAEQGLGKSSSRLGKPGLSEQHKTNTPASLAALHE